MYKHKEGKLDIMMELERLKELQLQEQREISRKTQQKEGALVIIDQIKEKDRERLKKREIQAKERQLMMRQIKEMQKKEQQNKREFKTKN